MISSITTTVTMIMSDSISMGLIASLGTAAVVTLIAVLIVKELAVGNGHSVSSLRQNLDAVILPLLFVFTFIVSFKVWDIIS